MERRMIKIRNKNEISTRVSDTLFFFCRACCAFFVALVLTLIFQEVMDLGKISFIFLYVTFFTGLMSLSRSWQYMRLIIFYTLVIAVGYLLKFYINIAPG